MQTSSTSTSLRWQLLLVAAVFILPTAILGIYLAGQRGNDRLEELRSLSLGLARTTALQQAAGLDLVRQRLAAIAAMLADGSPEECPSILHTGIQLHDSVVQLAFADRAGDLTCTAQPLSGEPPNVAERGYFQRALKHAGFQLSEVLLAERLKRWVLVGAQPVQGRNGDVLGIVMAGIAKEFTEDMLRTLPLPAGSHLSLVDSDGRIVARVPEGRQFVGRHIIDRDQFHRSVAMRGDDFIDGPGVDRVYRIVAYAKVPGYALYARVGVPKSAADKARNEVLFSTLAVVGLVLAAVLLLGWMVSRRLFVDPVLALERASRDVAGGALQARTGIPHGAGAFGEIARKFDELAAQRERVTRALRTLSAGNQVLLRERDERSLLQAMCRAAVEKGGYPLAMVIFPRHDEDKGTDVGAVCGDEAFARSLKMSWGDDPAGQGTVGQCLRSGERAISHSYADDPRLGAWRDQALARGYKSVISLPLRVQSTLIGTFTLVAAELEAFDAAEVDLLDEMAADLSFGIENIRAEARRREAEAIARRALSHDVVVDLPNRATFIRMVADRIARARRQNTPVSVLSVHIGRLQEIFDTFGFEPYRAILKDIAARLQTVQACEDSLGRLPMEDFGVVLQTGDASAIGEVTDRLLSVFRQPISIGQVGIDVQASVGLSRFPEHGDDGESLVRWASIAARQAFQRELKLQEYRGVTERENPARLALAADLRTAIEADALKLHYQPKVRIADSALIGCEALVRWTHPSRGSVAPGTFIPIAEQTGMIGAMTQRVLRMASRQESDWLRDSMALPIAVNLSARNLYDPELVKSIQRLQHEFKLAPGSLEFEITESALVEEPELARKTLMALRAMGAKLYIDDFGTGYSSLSYLVTLPVHALKIDRSFIRHMASSDAARGVVSAIVAMAHNLGMGVVAEGVETAADHATLKSIGCDEAQGYFFGKPVAAEEFPRRR